MKLLGFLIGASLAGQIRFLNEPRGTKVRSNLPLTGQNVLDIHAVVAGEEPSHILAHEGSSFFRGAIKKTVN